MSSFDRSTHRLAGSGNETGGLIIKRKKESGEGDDFKKPSAPRGSVLGLDVLARRKKEERELEEGVGAGKRPRLGESEGNYDSDIRISFGKSDHSKVHE